MQSEFLLSRESNNYLDFGKLISTSVQPHFHSHIEIYLVKSGQLEVFINNERRILTSGEISVALSYDVHTYNKPEDAFVYYIIIPPSFCKEFLQLVPSEHTRSPFICDKKTYETVLHSLEKMTAERPHLNKISKQGYVLTILGAILDQLPKQKEASLQNPPTFSDMLIYVSKHFKENISLSTLATEFGYNPSYLSRSFRKTFGISFNQYVKMLRLREALILLNKKEFSITDCAFESGFGSTRSFYRAFKEEFGRSPNEYIRSGK